MDAAKTAHALRQRGIDPTLLRRLLSRSTRPGLLSQGLVRRILALVEEVNGRLPLLDDVRRRHGQKIGYEDGQMPVVHAVWAPSAEPVPESSPTQTLRTEIRTVERQIVQGRRTDTSQATTPLVTRSTASGERPNTLDTRPHPTPNPDAPAAPPAMRGVQPSPAAQVPIAPVPLRSSQETQTLGNTPHVSTAPLRSAGTFATDTGNPPLVQPVQDFQPLLHPELSPLIHTRSTGATRPEELESPHTASGSSNTDRHTTPVSPTQDRPMQASATVPRIVAREADHRHSDQDPSVAGSGESTQTPLVLAMPATALQSRSVEAGESVSVRSLTQVERANPPVGAEPGGNFPLPSGRSPVQTQAPVEQDAPASPPRPMPRPIVRAQSVTEPVASMPTLPSGPRPDPTPAVRNMHGLNTTAPDAATLPPMVSRRSFRLPEEALSPSNTPTTWQVSEPVVLRGAGPLSDRPRLDILGPQGVQMPISTGESLEPTALRAPIAANAAARPRSSMVRPLVQALPFHSALSSHGTQDPGFPASLQTSALPGTEHPSPVVSVSSPGTSEPPLARPVVLPLRDTSPQSRTAQAGGFAGEGGASAPPPAPPVRPTVQPLEPGSSPTSTTLPASLPYTPPSPMPGAALGAMAGATTHRSTGIPGLSSPLPLAGQLPGGLLGSGIGQPGMGQTGMGQPGSQPLSPSLIAHPPTLERPQALPQRPEPTPPKEPAPVVKGKRISVADLDLNELVDHVQRKLVKQMASERERRGLSR